MNDEVFSLEKQHLEINKRVFGGAAKSESYDTSSESKEGEKRLIE